MTISSDYLIRLAALGTSLGTLAFLFIGDDWTFSNIFLVPDLLVCTVLLAGVVMPSRVAQPVLLVGFATGIGVFSTAIADYLVQGRFGIGAAVALATSVFACLYLLASLNRPA